jgi:general secretion pathway protein J
MKKINGMKKIKGFTLLEILVALTIFAILAVITSSSLYYAFNTRNKVNIQANRLRALQFAISIVEQDTSQIVDRAVRGNEMRLFPMLIGQAQYMEFTRDGILNPNSLDKRSTLKRVGLACVNGSLVRRTWSALDAVDRNVYRERVLINDIDDCHFSYLNHSLQSLPEWREQAVTEEQKPEIFPKALQINLTLKDWGKMNLLFIIPEALYAPK